MFLPDGNVSTVVFERVVVWGMDQAHYILNNLVLPNVVEFVVTLPWRLLLVVFPTLPPPDSKGVYVGSEPGKSRGRLAARLQHLRMPLRGRDESPQVEEVPPPAGDTKRAQVGRDRKASATAVKSGETLKKRGSPAGDGVRARSGAAGVADALKKPNLGRRNALAGGEDDSVGRKESSDKSPEGSMRNGGRSTRGSSSSERSSRSPSRRSFGEMVRSAITGDFNIRVRDHLFDLKTASPSLGTPRVGRSAASRAGPERQGGEDDGSVLGEASTDRPGRGASTKDKARRVAGRETGLVGKGKGESGSSPQLQPRYMTRQRYAEKMKTSAGGFNGEGNGGVDVPGGTGGEAHGRELHRRGGLDRSASRGRGDLGLQDNSLDGSLRGRRMQGRMTPRPSRGGSGSAGRSTSAESRAERLLEWRRKRAEQIEAQQSERVKGSKPGIAFGTSSSGGAQGAEDQRSEASFRTRVSKGASRRFRHVERFRAEVSGATDKAKEPDASLASPKTAPSPGAASTDPRE